MYNSGPNHSANMAFQKQRGVGVSVSGRSRVLIAIVIASLAVSLITRYATSASSQVHLAQSVKHRTADSRRQHLDKDAISWVTPVASVSLDNVPVLFAQVIPPPPLCCHSFLGESLYYRPPPGSRSFVAASSPLW
jgi:hypothetical protein